MQKYFQLSRIYRIKGVFHFELQLLKNVLWMNTTSEQMGCKLKPLQKLNIILMSELIEG